MGESAGVRKREVQTKETRMRRIEKDTYTHICIKRTGRIKGAEKGGRKRLEGEKEREAGEK